MKKVFFDNKSLVDSSKDLLVVNLNENYTSKNDTCEELSLLPIITEFSDPWCKKFSSWISSVNSQDNNVFWWAHTSTAKNLLSSRLGERFLQTQALCKLIRETDSNLYIKGATQGQIESLNSLFAGDDVSFFYSRKKLRSNFNIAKIFCRLLYQLFSVFLGFLSFKSKLKKSNIDIFWFTYLDGKYEIEKDGYFGDLLNLIGDAVDPKSIRYLAYLYTPYKKRINKLKESKCASVYMTIFSFLTIKDYFWSLMYSVVELFHCAFFKKKAFDANKNYNSLLREALLEDISIGGYFYHLLVYRAVKKAVGYYQPKKLVYPFENKPIEKMILLAISEINGQVQTVGYQHTSITPRHITLLLEPNEVHQIPLPDKIVTIGKITADYLMQKGNYPPRILQTACALRQVWKTPYKRNPRKEVTNILLPLSSSKFELIESIRYFQRVFKVCDYIKLGVRPHINFSLNLLPEDLLAWVNENAIDFSGTHLDDNLQWCDVTAYVSSTVALESMMRGKPIISIDIGDYVTPDPVLGSPDFYYKASDVTKFLVHVAAIVELSNEEYEEKLSSALDYIKQYFAPISEKAIKEFI